MTHAMSGAGLVMMEATAVEERGRITHGCLGIYSDSHQAAIVEIPRPHPYARAAPGQWPGYALAHPAFDI